MSKELEAFERIKNHTLSYVGDTYKTLTDSREMQVEDLDIIETALKNYEELTNKPVILYGKTQALIDAICKAHKEVKVITIIDEKKIRAFDIIKKKRVNVLELCTCANYETYLAFFNKWNWYGEYDEYILTQEEYDLLREVLLCQQ